MYLMRLMMVLFAFLPAVQAQPTAAESPLLVLATEDYPPFNMRISQQVRGGSRDEITGISTDIVLRVMERTGIPHEIGIYPWERAYKMALEQPHHGVFSTTRTEAREPLFRWVGPLVSNNWVMFRRRGDENVTVKSLEEAKQYRVGGYQGDAIEQFLRGAQFPQLDVATNDQLNVNKLLRGRIDLWATSEAMGPYLAARLGKAAEIEPAFTFQETQMYLALHRETSDARVAQLQTALDGLRAEGVVDEIYRRYR